MRLKLRGASAAASRLACGCGAAVLSSGIVSAESMFNYSTYNASEATQVYCVNNDPVIFLLTVIAVCELFGVIKTLMNWFMKDR